jgi:hypothetical protein
MNKNFTALLERVRAWPLQAQEELEQLAMEIDAELRAGTYLPMDEDTTLHTDTLHTDTPQDSASGEEPPRAKKSPSKSRAR